MSDDHKEIRKSIEGNPFPRNFLRSVSFQATWTWETAIQRALKLLQRYERGFSRCFKDEPDLELRLEIFYNVQHEFDRFGIVKTLEQRSEKPDNKEGDLGDSDLPLERYYNEDVDFIATRVAPVWNRLADLANSGKINEVDAELDRIRNRFREMNAEASRYENAVKYWTAMVFHLQELGETKGMETRIGFPDIDESGQGALRWSAAKSGSGDESKQDGMVSVQLSAETLKSLLEISFSEVTGSIPELEDRESEEIDLDRPNSDVDRDHYVIYRKGDITERDAAKTLGLIRAIKKLDPDDELVKSWTRKIVSLRKLSLRMYEDRSRSQDPVYNAAYQLTVQKTKSPGTVAVISERLEVWVWTVGDDYKELVEKYEREISPRLQEKVAAATIP